MQSLLYVLGLVLGIAGAGIAVAAVVITVATAIARLHALVAGARVDPPPGVPSPEC